MRNFLVFIALVFTGLFLAVFMKKPQVDSRPILKVYGSSSFIAQWGPGPWLRDEFEKTCQCKVDYYDGADSVILLQKLKSDSRGGGADLVLGLDQYDLEAAYKGFEWKKVELSQFDFEDEVRPALAGGNLIPYDWGIMAFVGRQSQQTQFPKSFEDLLSADFKDQISLQDPRTSSPGLQFLLWLIRSKGEEGAFQFLRKLNQQVHSYSNSWSKSYGLFQKNIVKLTFSYVTSPAYHLTQEKDPDVVAFEFSERHPIQFEFMGIPSSCKNCELAEKFVELMLSKSGQKVIMEKNFMFPAIKGVREGVFAQIPRYKTLDMTILPTEADRERLLKRWAALRREE